MAEIATFSPSSAGSGVKSMSLYDIVRFGSVAPFTVKFVTA